MQTKRLVLQERDYLLLNRLCEFGYLTLNQIEKSVFMCRRKKCLKRLSKLAQFELITFAWRKDCMGIRVCRPILQNLKNILSPTVIQRGSLARPVIGSLQTYENHEDLVREVAAKQHKVGITGCGFEGLNKFIEAINMKSKRRIRTPEILELAVSKLTEADIPVILERSYTAEDKIEILLDSVNSAGNGTISREELLRKMVENFESQFKAKGLKVNKAQPKAG